MPALPVWTFRVDELTTDGVGIHVTVSFFDAAADPSLLTALHTASFSFSPDMPATDYRTDIIGTGQNARSAIARHAALAQAFPVGTTGLVP